MKAAVVQEPSKLIIKKVEDPKIDDQQVLVEVKSTSICNATDSHILHGEFDGYHDFYPQILGHEVFGEIIQVGNNVKDLCCGEQVVFYSPRGAFCEYVAMNPLKDPYAKVPIAICSQEASLCEMFHGSYVSMIYPANVKPTDDVLVIGQGPMGLTATQLLKLKARTVITVDLNENRINKSLEVGSDYAYNHSEMSMGAIIADIKQKIKGVDKAFMCIDLDKGQNLDAFDLAVEALREEGMLLGLKVAVKNVNHRVNPRWIFEKNIQVGPGADDAYKKTGALSELGVFQDGVNLVAKGNINMGTLISHKISLEDLEDALELCRSKEDEVIKVVVRI